MAIFDGSKSLQIASDDFREHECGPCLLAGRTREAKHYCIDCPDYLCDGCKDYHRTLAVTRNHTIMSGSRIPVSAKGKPSLGIICGCNKGQPVEFYCDDHQEIICGACKTFSHHICTTSTIQEKSSDYRTSQLDSILAEIKSLEVKYERLKQDSTGSKKEVNKLKEDCQKEIKRYRKELDTIFENLESNILTELDKWKQDRHCHADQNVSTIDAALNMLRVDCKRLEDAKKDGKKEAMFVADTQVSKSIHGFASKLAELEKDIEKPNLAFERNKLLADLIAGVNSLGSLLTQCISDNQDNKLSGKPYSTDSTKMLKDRNIKSSREVNVKTDEDKKDPWISGCAVMPNGHVVLCDPTNKLIKVLDDSWTMTGRLKLPDSWDVSVIDSNNVIVSSPDKKQLQKVQVFPKMKTGRTIKLNKMCWGVAVSGEEIYTTCHDNPGQGEVKVLDLQGNIKRRLGINPDGAYLLSPSVPLVRRSLFLTGDVMVLLYQVRRSTQHVMMVQVRER